MLSDKDLRMTAAASPSFDKDYILRAEEDFQNMDSYNLLDLLDCLGGRVSENIGMAAGNTDRLHSMGNLPFDPYYDLEGGNLDKDNNFDSVDDNDVNSY
jgi:hypothetical protein